jgi:hypothetical protein
MRKFAAVMCVALGLATLPNLAQAAPIGTNGCTFTGIYECDIFVDDVTGLSTLDATVLDPTWLVGYTFLLNAAADLSNGIQETDVAHALVFHRSLIQLFTPTVTNPSQFSQAIADALALKRIDNVELSLGQIVGEPVSTGVNQLNGVGLFLTADSVTMLVNWGQDIHTVGGLPDLLTVHTALAPGGPGPNPVPEPGTLSLMLLGGGGAIASALRRRRTRVTA